MLHAFTLFAGAFLMFAAEPMLGKRLLPWFGGTPATWTTCLLFFQSVLFAGYAFAAWAIRRVPARGQVLLALAVLAVGLASLPLGPMAADRPAQAAQPTGAILWLLLLRAGPVFFALSSAAPLIQDWFARAGGSSPYRMYAASNAGSLLGLIAYPVWLEPSFDLDQLARVCSWMFAAFAAAFALCARTRWRARAAPQTPALTSAALPVRRGARALWFALSATASALLLAVTNYITVDLAPTPFLWVVPLALYLLSFVLTFGSGRAYVREWVVPLWVGCSAALCVGVFQQNSAWLGLQLAAFLCSLFAGCMLCHGELARLRPAAADAAGFYLWVAGGGASGSLFVVVLAPLLFKGFYELQIAVLAAYLALLALLWREPRERARVPLRWAWFGTGLALALIAMTIWMQGRDHTRTGRVIEQRRNFYGVLRVTEFGDVRTLSHGRIRHGMQFRDAARAALPTMYFGPESGVGRALRLHAAERARRIGVVGLGVGTLASYATARDRLRFYELSPDVVALARSRFSFLQRTPAHVDVAIGDGRLLLEHEPAQAFDLLVLDAFSSDAVPVHLLTSEAFAIYRKQLRGDGVLMVNVSNRYLDVERVVAGAALRHGFAFRVLETRNDAARGWARVRWMLLGSDPAELERLLLGATPAVLHGPPVLWTDRFSNLLQILK